MSNFFKFVIKWMGLVLAPIAFGYAGFYLAFMANNESATYVVGYAIAGFGLMVLNHLLGHVKSMGWGFASMAIMAFAGINVMWSATTPYPDARFLFNAFVLVSGIAGLYGSFKSYEEPKPEPEQ